MRLCLVCDDHPLVRDALGAAIRRGWPQAEVVEASDYLTAWRLAERGPDLCLVDLDMPGVAPLEGLSGLQRRAPGARLLVVTAKDDDDLLLDVLALGVDGFAPKSSDVSVLDAAIRVVLAGGRYLPPRLAELAQRPDARDRPRPAQPGVCAPYGRLSDRQLDVLKLLVEGRSNKEIARELELSPATVKTHVARVMAALGASNRTEATRRAQALGLADHPSG